MNQLLPILNLVLILGLIVVLSIKVTRNNRQKKEMEADLDKIMAHDKEVGIEMDLVIKYLKKHSSALLEINDELDAITARHNRADMERLGADPFGTKKIRAKKVKVI